MTSTTLNGFGLEPQWDFSTFRYQLPEKLAVCPAQTPSATERNVGTNHERILMAGFLMRSSSGYRILLAPPKGKRDLAGWGWREVVTTQTAHAGTRRDRGGCRSAQAIGDDGWWLGAGHECRPSRDAISGNIGSSTAGLGSGAPTSAVWVFSVKLRPKTVDVRWKVFHRATRFRK